MEPFRILFEDASSLAIVKPSGLLVHRSEDTSRREEAVLQLLRQQVGYRVYPVHRLDRATSGILLFAKTPVSAAYLGKEFAAHRVQKSYLAVARGWPPTCLVIDDPLADLDAPHTPRQSAVTELERLATIELPLAIDGLSRARYSLLHLQPQSGRRHQLRRHLKHINHPLIGDTVYGRGAHNRYFREHYACPRLLLHHARLAWKAEDGTACSVRAPVDSMWHKVLEAFAWEQAYRDWSWCT